MRRAHRDFRRRILAGTIVQYLLGFLEQRSGAQSPLAVESQVPCDPDQPDARIFNRRQLPLILQHAKKRLLHYVFGIIGISQNAESHAKQES